MTSGSPFPFAHMENHLERRKGGTSRIRYHQFTSDLPANFSIAKGVKVPNFEDARDLCLHMQVNHAGSSLMINGREFERENSLLRDVLK
jgi:hypothetical protein